MAQEKMSIKIKILGVLGIITSVLPLFYFGFISFSILVESIKFKTLSTIYMDSAQIVAFLISLVYFIGSGSLNRNWGKKFVI